MNWISLPLVTPLAISVLIHVFLIAYLWRLRTLRGSKPFIVLAVAAIWWLLAYALSILLVDPAAKLLWNKLQYFGVVVVPTAWLIFVIHYTGHSQRLSWPVYLLLSIEPLVTLALVWTNDHHHWYWTNLTLVNEGIAHVIRAEYGPARWFHAIYTYGVVLVLSVLLLMQKFFVSPSLYRRQIGVLLLGALAPWLGDALSSFGLIDLPVTLTPFGFVVTSLAAVWGISRLHLWTLVPIARSAVVESMQGGVIVLDMENRIADINPVAARIVGRAPEDVIGQPLSRVVTAWHDIIERYRNVFEAHDEVTLVRDAEELTYDMYISPLRDLQGRVSGRLIVFYDVTERKRTESQLLAQTRLYESLIAMSRAMVKHVDLEAALQSTLNMAASLTNAPYGSIFLLDAEGNVTHSLVTDREMTPRRRQEVLQEVMENGLAGWVVRNRQPALVRDTTQDERWIDRPDRTYPVRSAFAIPITSGPAILGVMTLMHPQPDYFNSSHIYLIHSSVDQIVLAVRNAQMLRAIANERSRLEALIEASRDGIVLIGVEQTILVANAPAFDILHLTGKPDEWVNTPLGEILDGLSAYAPRAAQAIRAELARVQAGDDAPGECECEIPPRVIRLLNLPVVTSSVRIGRLLVLRDVTEERLLDSMRQDLIRAMVHDLRNPLTAIYGALSFLNDTATEAFSETQRELWEIALNNTNSLLRLVKSILEISQLETRQLPLEPTLIPLQKLILTVLESLLPLAAGKNIRLESCLPDELPVAWADQELLKRVLQNLIGNAIKFTPEDGRVWVTARLDEGERPCIRVSVRDNGPGVPPAIRDRLFQKFVTGGQQERGNGLGLAFCKMVIEAHGERIWLEETSEGGATFTFTLPLPPAMGSSTL